MPRHRVRCAAAAGLGVLDVPYLAIDDAPGLKAECERVRAMGVKPFYKRFKHDGVHGPNMATVYSDRGYGMRAPVVFYNRSNEAAALLKPGDFDWDHIFGKLGVRWLHTGGIFAALAPNTSEAVIEAVECARKHGTIVSYDLNYRASLWKSQGGKEGAQRINRNIAQLQFS